MLTSLVGASFRPASTKAIIKSLAVGDILNLVPEPDNSYDPNAIQLFDEDGEFLGYIPKEVAAEIVDEVAAMIEAEEPCFARVCGNTGTLSPHLDVAI